LKHIRLIGLILLIPFLFSGCASKPVEMIERTEKAMTEARETGADFFAPEDWKAAETAAAQAQSLLEQEKWSEANTALLRAMNRYSKSKEIAKDKKEAFLREVQGYQTVTEKRLKELKDMVAAAKLPAAKKQEVEAECQAIGENTAKVTKQLAEGQFSDGKLLAQQMMRRVWEVKEEYFPSKGAK
jgi:hypothetical protein